MTAPFEGRTVLVVDDEPPLRELIARLFERRGFRTLKAGGGRDALELVRAGGIDVVVTDVRMADGSGVDLLDQIRAANPKVPVVILVSGFADLTPAEALRRGALGMLSKPFDRHELVAMVERALVG